MIVREILCEPNMIFDYYNDSKDTLGFLHGCLRQVKRTGEPFRVYRRDDRGIMSEILMGVPEFEAFIANFDEKSKRAMAEIFAAYSGKAAPVGKRDTWRQPTPLMQLVSLKNEFEGQFDNFKDRLEQHFHMLNVDTLIASADRFFDELEKLHPFLEKGSWD